MTQLAWSICSSYMFQLCYVLLFFSMAPSRVGHRSVCALGCVFYITFISPLPSSQHFRMSQCLLLQVAQCCRWHKPVCMHACPDSIGWPRNCSKPSKLDLYALKQMHNVNFHVFAHLEASGFLLAITDMLLCRLDAGCMAESLSQMVRFVHSHPS